MATSCPKTMYNFRFRVASVPYEGTCLEAWRRSCNSEQTYKKTRVALLTFVRYYDTRGNTRGDTRGNTALNELSEYTLR